MKIPSIPLPEPEYMITLTRGSDRSRGLEVHALRFLLWIVPAAAVDYILATADDGSHALWLTLAATYVTLILAVLTVNVRADGGKDAS